MPDERERQWDDPVYRATVMRGIARHAVSIRGKTNAERQALAAERRALFVRLTAEGQSAAQIARAHGVSPSRVRSILARAAQG